MAAKKAPVPKIDAATQQAIVDADDFVNAGRARNQAAKLYELAKAGLRKWLGTELSKALPDGRTVALTVTDTAGYTVEAGTKSTLTVSPPPAA
jgi:hypothetical protein